MHKIYSIGKTNKVRVIQLTRVSNTWILLMVCNFQVILKYPRKTNISNKVQVGVQRHKLFILVTMEQAYLVKAIDSD